MKGAHRRLDEIAEAPVVFQWKLEYFWFNGSWNPCGGAPVLVWENEESWFLKHMPVIISGEQDSQCGRMTAYPWLTPKDFAGKWLGVTPKKTLPGESRMTQGCVGCGNDGLTWPCHTLSLSLNSSIYWFFVSSWDYVLALFPLISTCLW